MNLVLSGDTEPLKPVKHIRQKRITEDNGNQINDKLITKNKQTRQIDPL